MNVERPEGLIEDAGRRGEPRRLDQMISVRLDPLLVAALRKLAEARGVSLSDVLREAALQLLAHEEAQNVRTFCVEVTNETRPEARRDSYRQDVPLAVLQFMENTAELGSGVAEGQSDMRVGGAPSLRLLDSPAALLSLR